MTVWQKLKIRPTNEPDLIKKAYRVLLKEYHPEDDPEGFKQLREAYEHALAECQKQPTAFTNIHIISSTENEYDSVNKTIELAEENHSPSLLINQFELQIDNPYLRYQIPIWQEWLQKVQLVSLANQQEISSHVLHEILDKDWISGNLVALFWHGLGWSLLQQSNAEEQQIATILEQRIFTEDIISLNTLSTLPHGQQVTSLRLTNMLQEMLRTRAPGAIRYLLRSMSVLSIIPEKKFVLLLLQAYRAADIWPSYTLISLLDSLQSFITEMTADELILACEVSRKVEQEHLLQFFIHQMMALDLDTDAAEQMYQWHYETNLDLGLGFAYLYHQQRPQIPAFWLLHRYWAQPQTDISLENRRYWLYKTLLNQHIAQSHFLHKYQFQRLSTPAEWMLSGLWTGKSGSWHSLREWHHPEFGTMEPNAWSWNLLMQLIKRWHQHLLNHSAIPLSLQEKLTHYETDGWYQSSGYVKDTIHQLELNAFTQEQWQDFYRRHPMIPQRWFDALVQSQMITLDSITNDHLMTHHLRQLSFWRLKDNDSFDLEHPWDGLIFRGNFEWSVRFYSLLSGFDPSRIESEIPDLPALANSTLLGYCQPFIDSKEPLKLDLLPSHLIEYDHPVIQVIYDQQIQLMAKIMPSHQLLHGFERNNIPELLALSLNIQELMFDESIILWNLIRSHRLSGLDLAITTALEQLKQTRKSLGLEKDEYDEKTKQLVHSFLHDELSSIPLISKLHLLSPQKEIKSYYYPLILICSILQTEQNQFNSLQLNHYKLLMEAQDLNPSQQFIAEYGLSLLAKKINYQISEDQGTDKKIIKKYSLKNLGRAGWITGLVSYISDGHLWAVGLAASITVIFCWYIQRLIASKSNRNIYLILTTLVMFWGLGIVSFGSGLAMLIWHVGTPQILPNVRANGFWENALFDKDGNFDLITAIKKAKKG